MLFLWFFIFRKVYQYIKINRKILNNGQIMDKNEKLNIFCKNKNLRNVDFLGFSYAWYHSVSPIYVFINDGLLAFLLKHAFFTQAFQKEGACGVEDDIFLFNDDLKKLSF